MTVPGIAGIPDAAEQRLLAAVEELQWTRVFPAKVNE
jgi:hypothetical protein